MHYVSNTLGIRDPIHKQKIALKAMDVVLFGPPRGKLQFGIFFIILSFEKNVTILQSVQQEVISILLKYRYH